MTFCLSIAEKCNALRMKNMEYSLLKYSPKVHCISYCFKRCLCHEVGMVCYTSNLSSWVDLGWWVRCQPGLHLIEEEGEQGGRVWTERVRENQKGLEVHKYILKVIFFLTLFISKIEKIIKNTTRQFFYKTRCVFLLALFCLLWNWGLAPG